MSPSPLASGKGLDYAYTLRPTGSSSVLSKKNLRYKARAKKTHMVSFPVGKNGRIRVERVLSLFLEKKGVRERVSNRALALLNYLYKTF